VTKFDSAVLRVARSGIGEELIAELSAFDVNCTPSGNLTVSVRIKRQSDKGESSTCPI
jgi:hypothetical protein